MSTNSPSTQGNNTVDEEESPAQEHQLKQDLETLEALVPKGRHAVVCYLRELERCIHNGEIHIKELRQWQASGKRVPQEEHPYWLKVRGEFGLYIVSDEYEDARLMLALYRRSIPALAAHVGERRAAFDEIDEALRHLLRRMT